LVSIYFTVAVKNDTPELGAKKTLRKTTGCSIHRRRRRRFSRPCNIYNIVCIHTTVEVVVVARKSVVLLVETLFRDKMYQKNGKKKYKKNRREVLKNTHR